MTPEEVEAAAEDVKAMENILQDTGDEVEISTQESGGVQEPEIDLDKDLGGETATAEENTTAGQQGATEATVESVQDEPDEFEKSLEEIKPRPNAKTTTIKAIDAIKGKAKEAHLRSKEWEKKYKAEETARKQAESRPLAEPVEKELTELRTFRRIHDIQGDAEFQQQFDVPIQQHEQESISLLKEWGLNESAVNFISDHGGLTKFHASNEKIPAGTANSTDESGEQITHAEWFDKVLMPRLTAFQRDELRDHLADSRKLIRAKASAVKAAAANPEKWEQDKAKQIEERNKDWQTRAEKRAKELIEELGDLAKKKPIPPKATQAEREKIEAENTEIDRSAGIANKYLRADTPELRTEAAIYAASGVAAPAKLRAKDEIITNLETELKKANETIDKIKNAGKTSKLNNAPVSSNKPAPTGNKTDEQIMAEMVA